MRKVFSSNFVISALSVEETGTTVWRAWLYQAEAISEHNGVIPPMTFGVLYVVQSFLPGSTRSGEKARKKSFPTSSPALSLSIGSRISRVVPGYVVDSRTITIPACMYFASSSVAEII
jgi:hypothetical protein